MTAMTDWITVTDIEGTPFDADYFWRWIEAQRVGCWFWSDWETALLYRDPQIRIGEPN